MSPVQINLTSKQAWINYTWLQLNSILIRLRDFTLLSIFNVLTNLATTFLSSKMLHQMAVNAPAYSFKNGKQPAELTKFISKVFFYSYIFIGGRKTLQETKVG